MDTSRLYLTLNGEVSLFVVEVEDLLNNAPITVEEEDFLLSMEV